jgi:hypothetical protein
MRYRLVNRGSDFLDSVYVSLWQDGDMGDANDDYIGTDMEIEGAYIYNGDSDDEIYGAAIPALGTIILQGPLVEAPDEQAVLPDGTLLYGYKMLDMTASFGAI